MKNLFYTISILLCFSQIVVGQTQVGQTFIGTNPEAHLGFSNAITSDGQRIVMGAPGNNTIENGYVEVYDWNGSSWSQVGNTILGATFNAGTFGGKVDISNDGSRILISSRYSFYVFDLVGNSWVQVGDDPFIQYLKLLNGLELSGDGNSVAYGYPDNYLYFIEKAEIYELNSNTWQLKGNAIVSNNPQSYFGGSVAINEDGTIIAVGAASYSNPQESGKTYVYQWNGNAWNQLGGTISNPNTLTSEFGSYVDLNDQGDRLAVISREECTVFDFQNGSWNQIGNPIIPFASGLNIEVTLSGQGNVVGIGVRTFTPGGDANGIFQLSNGSWNQIGNLIYGDTDADDFDSALDLNSDGSRLVSGAGESNIGTSNNDGYVKVFDLPVVCSWDKQVGLQVNGESSSDQFGTAMRYSADGQFLIAGSAYGDGNGSNSGEVRIFEKNGNSWTQRGATLIGDAAGDRFGRSVAISDNGKYALVGAYLNDDGGQNSGLARMYKWNGSNYLPYGSDINGVASFDYTGYAVDISSSGKYFAVGSPYDDTNGSGRGKIQVYKRSSSNHYPVGLPIIGQSNAENLGKKFRLSGFGLRIAIGLKENDDVANNTGQVRVYNYNGSNNPWVQIGQDLNGVVSGDYFGGSISFNYDGNALAVGAYGADPNGNYSGQMKMYTLSGPSWIQKGSTLNGGAAYDYFGLSSDISDSGNRLVVGAAYSDLNGSASGHITVFDYNNGAWAQSGDVVTGDNSGDYFGVSVSITSNGTSIAVGARGDDNGGNYSGSVQIVETCSSNTKSMTTSGNSTNSSDFTPTVRTSTGVSVFPNPTAGLLEIAGISDGSKVIQLFNNSGALVFSQEISENTFDISELPGGTYHLLITHEGSDYQLTVVKK